MTKVVVINGGNGGSTGKIIYGIYDLGKKDNYDFKIFTPPGNNEKKNLPDNVFIGSRIERRMSDILSQMTGNMDSGNILNTLFLINKIEEMNPDIIHLHNMHGNYVNIRMLFRYLNRINIPIVWTLHDCWSMTGHCCHFVMCSCEKWKTGCYDCDNISVYPESMIDKSKCLYAEKKKLFTSLNKVTIVTPSEWLGKVVDESYLNCFPRKVINNGVDLNVFKPRVSDFRNKYHIEDKFVILAVAPLWTRSKGLDRIIDLANRLPQNFVVVIVGKTDEKIQGDNIIKINKTDNQIELAELYSTADVFLNPTREDTFPTVNLEALACGTPVLSYGACGSAEAFNDDTGRIVDDTNILSVINEIAEEQFNRELCLQRGREFDQTRKFEEYIKLYKKIVR